MTHVSSIKSDMGWSTPDRIVVRGHDLPGELLGELNLGDMAWLEIIGRKPNAAESRMFNALLLTLVEHGMTPMAIAARLIYMGAPESMQGAVAAGLCGLGTTFAGTAEGAARILQSALRDQPDADLDALARRIVADHRERRAPIPGIGHPLHKPIDPRTPRLFEIAAETGFSGRYVDLMQRIAAEAERASGKSLPVNATGAMGAIASELGLDWRLCRGIAVMGRAVGLVGHLAEEIRNPIARPIWEWVEETASAHAKGGAE
jgi:citrate synthase